MGLISGDQISGATKPLDMDFSVDLTQMETALKAMSAALNP
jgi:hypothetical protein